MLGEKFRLAREAKGWTQEQLATRARVSGPLISKIENNQPVRSDSLNRVADVLGLRLSVESSDEDSEEQPAHQLAG